ncbi:hypothetical protein GCM10028807_12700 [Spirosoma daeguense]
MLERYFFIDESGDSEFYGKRKRLLVGTEGFQPLLILGLVETSNRKRLREAVITLQQQILSDTLYRSIPSVKEPNWFFHARNDHPEVRAEFFKLIRSYDDLRFHAVIGRKDLDIFNRKHNNNSVEFYFDLVAHLLQEKLQEETEQNIYLAHKPKTTQKQLVTAIDKAIQADNGKLGIQQKIRYSCTVEQSSKMPELSVVDYLLWALHRYLLKGEIRFWEAVEPCVSSVLDLYDDEKQYDGKNTQLRLEKMKPFDLLIGQQKN